MLRLEMQSTVQVFAPFIQGLARNAEHEIKAEPLDARCPNQRDGFFHSPRFVCPVERREMARLKTLHTDTGTSDADGGQRLRLLRGERSLRPLLYSTVIITGADTFSRSGL